MQLDARIVLEHWGLVLALLVLPALGKFALIGLLARAFGVTGGTAIRSALALMQAGEFGFVVVAQASRLQLIERNLYQPVIAALLLSMLGAPLLIHYSGTLAVRLSSSEWLRQSLALTAIARETMQRQQHVVICGFGRSGQSIGRLLAEEDIDYMALDLDPDRVQEASGAGAHVVYGDATRKEALTAAGVARARALVITFASFPAAQKILHHVRQLAPGLPVIVRTHDDSHLEALQQAGATEVVPEVIEGSLMMASQTLLVLGVPVARVLGRLRAAREKRYHLMRGFFAGASDAERDHEAHGVRLHAVTLPAAAFAVGRALESIDWGGLPVEITAIRRRGIFGLDPGPKAELQAEDVVILRGEEKVVLRAEAILLGA